MKRRVAEAITLPDGQTYTKAQLTSAINAILRECSGFCMDVEAERDALADILAVELLALEGFGPDIVRKMLGGDHAE